MQKVLTGLQPTGELTIGNYIGSIKQMVELQNDYDSYIFIADLHAITLPQQPEVLKKRIREVLALYIACGIDPEKNTIYVQSENEYIPCISWLLECNTYYGEASRMIQFKEKSKKNANFSVGLLTYPILMAADILYLDTDYVPVGIDQKQHVEIARDIADRFNKTYGETFHLPQPLIRNSGAKIKDLKDPTKKMSKSSENPNSSIRLLDPPEKIRKKIMAATTDSESSIHYDPEKKPGISNLLTICSVFSNQSISDLENQFKGKNYGEFKRYVADVLCEKLSEIQTKYEQLLNSNQLDEICEKGIQKARELAKEKYELMKDKMGLIRK